MMQNLKTKRFNSKGQALVEMAIILPILLLFVMGIFEYGRAMYIKNTLTQAARAGARTAVVTPLITDTPSPVKLDPNCNYSNTGNDSVYLAVCTSLYSGIKKNDVEVNITINDIALPTGLNNGDAVEVSVVLNDYLTNYRIIPFIPMKDTLSGIAAMRYE